MEQLRASPLILALTPAVVRYERQQAVDWPQEEAHLV